MWRWAGAGRAAFGADLGEHIGLVVGVVAAADERAALDDLEAAAEAFGLEVGELLGGDPAVDRQVVSCGLQVLADGQDVARIGLRGSGRR